VIAHSYSAEAVQHSVINGVRSIEHGNLIDAETATIMADHDAFLVPTLIAYDAMSRRAAGLGLPPVSVQKNNEVLASGQQAIALARDAGVRIGFGSDLMGELEDEQLGGLRLQSEVLGVLQTIRCATVTNADLIQRDDLGRLAPGAVGDLLILDGDVLADSAALWDDKRPRMVVRSGQIVVAPWLRANMRRPPRPTQSVFAGERLPVRLHPTVSDLPKPHGTVHKRSGRPAPTGAGGIEGGQLRRMAQLNRECQIFVRGLSQVTWQNILIDHPNTNF
jgi:hypothetical protein